MLIRTGPDREGEKEKQPSTEMKEIKTLIIVAALAVASLGRADPPPANQTITEADGGRTIDCQVGETLTVRISDPATGGYGIVTQVFDRKILKLLARKELPPEPVSIARHGDFGKIVLEFQAIGTGETDLVIRIARKWEVKQHPEQYFRVHIKVRK